MPTTSGSVRFKSRAGCESVSDPSSLLISAVSAPKLGLVQCTAARAQPYGPRRILDGLGTRVTGVCCCKPTTTSLFDLLQTNSLTAASFSRNPSVVQYITLGKQCPIPRVHAYRHVAWATFCFSMGYVLLVQTRTMVRERARDSIRVKGSLRILP